MTSVLRFLLIIPLVFSFACRQKSSKGTLARVNGDTITADEFRGRLAEYRVADDSPLGPNPEAATLKNRVLSEMIEEKVILAAAHHEDIEVTPDEVKRAISAITKDYPGSTLEEMLAKQHISRTRWRRRMEQKILMEKVIEHVTREVPVPAEAEITAYYNDHAKNFEQEEKVHLQQIVVKTREDGEKILEELKKGSSFEDLARRHSYTPEAAQGGDLGYVPKGIMPKVIDEAVAKLKTNQVSPVFETNYGFHVVRVLERRSASKLSLEEARPRIIEILTEKDREEKFANWRKSVLAKAKIERNHGLLAAIR